MKKITYLTLILLVLISACTRPQSTEILSTPGEVQQTTEIAITQQPPTPLPPTPTATPPPQERMSIGQQAMLEGDYDTALEQFWKVRSESTDPEMIVNAQLGVGKVLLLKGDARAAIEQLQGLLSNFSEGETRNTASFFLGKAYLVDGQYQQAADAFGNYVDSQPGPLDGKLLEMQGDALMKAEAPESAKTTYEKAISAAHPNDIEPLQIKIARAEAQSGDPGSAVTTLLSLYETSSTDYIKSQANFLLGQVYMEQGLPDQAYARFQDSVAKYPTFYDTYSGLVVLVEAGEPVNDLMRGIIDYYAGQYGVATEAFDRYMKANPEHDGTSHYYKALSLYAMGNYEGEIAEWDQLIQDHPTDQFLPQAYLEKSSTQWRSLSDYIGSAQTLLQFVARIPDSPKAAEYLNRAASIYEIGGYLTRAAKTWQRVFDEYPGSEYSYEALFKSAIVQYRQKKYEEAQVIFQRLLVLNTTSVEQSRSYFWVAKSLEKRGDQQKALEYFQQAASADPTGYYSIRANEILAGSEPFAPLEEADLAVDFVGEKEKAEKWLRSKFGLDNQVDISSPAELSGNPLYQRGETYWKLGMRDQARSEFEKLRKELQGDAVNTYRLMNHMLELGFYQTAALSSRQVLDTAGLSQAETLTDAPEYFNHIRFGVFYRDIILNAASENEIDPLLLFSIIRQESLFDASISSSAGARGLMQITEETGVYIAENYGWPPEYQFSDLDRPMINIRMGAKYFKYYFDKYNGNVGAALASYNAGDGNSQVWVELAGDDIDLFLEVIRFDETSNYIRYIRENYTIYQDIYTHP